MDDTRTLRRRRAPRMDLRLPEATPRSQAWIARSLVATYALALAAGIVGLLWAMGF